MFEGVNAVVTTPFGKTGSLDKAALRAKVKFLIRGGIRSEDGLIVANGSTGECYALTTEEQKSLYEIVMDAVEGADTRVILGSSSTSTRTAIELSKYARDLGADGVLNLPPYYWPLDERQLMYHYQLLNDAVDIPIMVYNNPGVTQIDIHNDVLEMICELANVKAVKDCTRSLPKMETLVRSIGDRIEVICGRGEFHEPYGYMMGTRGFVTIVANWDPETAVMLHRLAVAGDYAAFIEMKEARISPVFDWMAQLPLCKQVSLIKHMEVRLGVSRSEVVRAPALPLSTAEKRMLESILDKMGWYPSEN